MTAKGGSEKTTKYLSGETGVRSTVKLTPRCKIIFAAVAFILFVVILVLTLLFFVADIGLLTDHSGSKLYRENWKKSEDCSPPCGQRGTCYNANGVDFCFCDPGYKGIQCTEEKTSCLDDPCIHGSCRCGKGRFICVCTGNYTGRFCEAEKRTCTGPCQRSRTPPEPESGWVYPFNGFAYLVTQKEHKWKKAQQVCKEYKADLASVGIRNEGIRKFLARTYLKDNDAIWIGLSNTTGRNKWLWNDGREQMTKSGYWYEETPKEAKNINGMNNCALLDTRTTSKSYRSRRYSCGSKFKGLCEKRIYV